MPINKFTTLLDLARQAKIITGETATFDGKIQTGIPFSGYPTGVDTGTTVSLGVVSSETAVFSGNTGTTIFDVSNPSSPNYDALFSGYSGTVWTNPLFSATTSGLTLPITPLSAETQVIGPFWTLTQTGMTGDYVIGTQYTGYSVTYSFFGFDDPPTTAYTSYSGFTTATQENFSAGTLDYKGPLDYISSVEDATIDGRLTTNKLTVTGGASVGTLGYVLTQTGNTGETGWVFNSASGTTDTNFAITDLTFTGDRTHDTNGFSLNLEDTNGKFQIDLNDSSGPLVRLTGDTSSLTRFAAANTPNGGISMGHRGNTASFPGYGKQGDGFVYSSADENGLNIISQPGSGTEDYIRFYAGQDANGTTPDLYIDGDTARGNIGINTISPQSKLHILQETGTTPSLIIQASGTVPATDNASVLFMNNIEPRWGMGIENVGTLDFEIKKLNNGEFDFGNSGETVVHLDWTNKNVGIGISTPTEKLHVDGNTKIEGNNIGNPSLIIGDNDEITFTTLGTSITDNIEINSTPNSSAIKLNDGASGLGNQLQLLNFYNGSETYNAISANIGATDESSFFIGNNAVSGATTIRVGTGDTLADVLYLYGRESTGKKGPFSGITNEKITYVRDYLSVETILSIGNVGSTAFADDIRIDANGILTTNTSDERLKENINNLNGSLGTILQLSGVSYNWVDRVSGGDDIRYGFIAQRVDEVDTNLTTTNRVDGYMGLKSDCFTPLIVESIKEIYNNPSIPNYTPTSSNDIYGNVGNITTDDDYLYIKTNNGWKRTSLQSF